MSHSVRVHVDICSERDRQDQQWGGPSHDDDHSEDDWCFYIRKQVRLAEHAVDAESFAEYRERMVKIAALAVAALESYDRRERE